MTHFQSVERASILVICDAEKAKRNRKSTAGQSLNKLKVDKQLHEAEENQFSMHFCDRML